MDTNITNIWGMINSQWVSKWVREKSGKSQEILKWAFCMNPVPDCGQFVRNVRRVKISAEFIHGRRGSLNECLS